MSRYIDADELIFFGLDNPDDEHLFEFVPKEFIDNAPTVDAVEVVRCEDCRYFAHTVDWYECGFHDHYTMPDNYCSYGERRTDEQIH